MKFPHSVAFASKLQAWPGSTVVIQPPIIMIIIMIRTAPLSKKLSIAKLHWLHYCIDLDCIIDQQLGSNACLP